MKELAERPEGSSAFGLSKRELCPPLLCSLPAICYGAEILGDNFYERRETLRLSLVFYTGPFWYTQQLYFDRHSVFTQATAPTLL